MPNPVYLNAQIDLKSHRFSGHSDLPKCVRELMTTPMLELEAILQNHDQAFDEPDTVRFIAQVREQGIIGDDDWQEVLQWFDNAVVFNTKETVSDNRGVVSLDADPRNADWMRIVGAQRLAGYQLPHWAALWLWWIGHDQSEDTFWHEVGAVARTMGFPPLQQ